MTLQKTCYVKQQGYLLLAFLITIAITGIFALATCEVWSTLAEREKEEELLYVGDQYAQAIQRYYYATPGAARELPNSLEALVKDDRFPVPRRHLRQMYEDPVQPGTPWGVMLVGTQIIGVYSTSEQVPLKKAGFVRKYEGFSMGTAIKDWKFVFRAPAMPWNGSLMPQTENAPVVDQHSLNSSNPLPTGGLHGLSRVDR